MPSLPGCWQLSCFILRQEYESTLQIPDLDGSSRYPQNETTSLSTATTATFRTTLLQEADRLISGDRGEPCSQHDKY